MNDHAEFLDTIRRVAPDLTIDRVEVNQEGMINDVVIVNGETVFRFPKTDWGRQSLANEVALLDTIRNRVAVPVPYQVRHDASVSSYRMIRGEPLSRESLFWMTPEHRQIVLDQLGSFLRDLHAIPGDTLPQIGKSDSERATADWLAFYEQIEDIIFPLLFKHQRHSVRDLFAPVVSGRLEVEVDPVLIHGDLAPYHILLDPDAPSLTGVIDFGTAGMGDPATDIATLLVHYGGRIVDQIRPAIPSRRTSTSVHGSGRPASNWNGR